MVSASINFDVRSKTQSIETPTKAAGSLNLKKVEPKQNRFRLGPEPVLHRPGTGFQRELLSRGRADAFFCAHSHSTCRNAVLSRSWNSHRDREIVRNSKRFYLFVQKFALTFEVFLLTSVCVCLRSQPVILVISVNDSNMA